MAQTAHSEQTPGGGASTPWRIGARGWMQTLRRVRGEIKKDNLSLMAAGAAFFAFLAIFPALAAVFGIYGLVMDPAQVERQLAGLASVLPPSAAELLRQQMERLAAGSSRALGLGVLVALGVAVWSANRGMKGLVQAMNVAYNLHEHRGFVRRNAVTLAFTLVFVLGMVVVLALVALIPAILGRVGLGEAAQQTIDLLRWPTLAALVIVGLAALYRYGPYRENPHWSWVSPGAIAATVILLVASGLFSLYVSTFGNYTATYGSLAAVAILMLWLFIGAYSVLVGAEINAEAERQAQGGG
jgi:membrane protein